MNIAQNIKQGQRLFPDKTALIFEDETFTYCQLDEMSNQIANGLLGLGISRGDRVALILPNIPQFVIAYLGIQKMGAVLVSINPVFKENEIKFILDDSGATAVITIEALRRNIPAEELPCLKHILIADGQTKADIALSELMADASPKAQLADMAIDDPAAILYTSGTTGFPKGATVSHGNMISNVRMSVHLFRMQPDDRVLLFLPAFHSFGLTVALNSTFDACATLVLHREFNVTRVLKSITEHKVTIFFGVPANYLILYDIATPGQMKSVRFYISAATTLPLEISKKWQEKFNVVINEGYGLTECCQVCFNHFLKYKPGSVGAPPEGIKIKIVNAQGQTMEKGEQGEIAIGGPSVMPGYWNRPDETAEAIKEGWFHTGDIGYMDEDGYFYIADRAKDMINVGGQNVYPSEIENIIYQHPAVAEVAVYGVPDELMGEQVQANIILKPGASDEVTPDEITSFCQQNMADFKVPGIKFVNAIPKGKSGKILKRMLREQFLASSPEDEQTQAQQLSEASDSERYDILKAHIRNEVARIVGIEPGDQQDFFEIGMDSLMSVQLSKSLMSNFGVSLPSALIFKYPSVEQLTAYLTEAASESSPQASGDLKHLSGFDENVDKINTVIDRYIEVDSVMTPYVMRSSPPCFCSEAINTDKYGHRISYDAEGVVDSHSWWQRKRRGLLIGNSVAFGVGATSDRTSMISALNNHSNYSFLNLGVMAANSTQELTAAIPFLTESDCVLIFSGGSNLFLNLNQVGQYDLYGPFQGDDLFVELGKIRFRTVKKILKDPDSHKPQNLASENKARQGSELKLTQDEIESRFERAVALHRRDLQIIAGACGSSVPVLFALQPMAMIAKPNLTPEEEALFKYYRLRDWEWRTVVDPYAVELWPRYTEALRQMCSDLGVPFTDTSELDFEGWCFVDHGHMTDYGYDYMAKYLTKWLESITI
ncbi:MAG: long-chain-fatty-acid--CoA ligase [Hyphomicrobiales bacterium]|nr:long-chain-fatty-acid--CoA ligase [Hyphomicrobiales bacterium]